MDNEEINHELAAQKHNDTFSFILRHTIRLCPPLGYVFFLSITFLFCFFLSLSIQEKPAKAKDELQTWEKKLQKDGEAEPATATIGQHIVIWGWCLGSRQTRKQNNRWIISNDMEGIEGYNRENFFNIPVFASIKASETVKINSLFRVNISEMTMSTTR